MSKQLQLRRGTSAQHSSFTGLEGELTYDTDTKKLFIHDGSSTGGVAVSAYNNVVGQLLKTTIYQDDTGISNSSVSNGSSGPLTDFIAVPVTSGNSYTIEFSGPIAIGWYSPTVEDDWICSGGLYEDDLNLLSRYQSLANATARRTMSWGFSDIAGTAGQYGWFETFIRIDYSFTAASTTTTNFGFVGTAATNLQLYLNVAASQTPYCYTVREYFGDCVNAHGTSY